MGRIPPSVISSLLAAGTALIGAMLAYQYSSQATVAGSQVRNLLYAFLLTGLFTLTALLFAKGEAEAGRKGQDSKDRKEAA